MTHPRGRPPVYTTSLSQWAVRRADGVTASRLRDHLQTFAADDRLFVARIDNTEWASRNAIIDLNTP